MQETTRKRITVTYGRTYNLENYHSMRIDLAEEFDVEGTDKQIREFERKAFSAIKTLVENELRTME